VPGGCDVTVLVVYIDGANRVSPVARYLSVSRKIRNLDQIRARERNRRTFLSQLAAPPFPSMPLATCTTVPEISFSFNLRKNTAICVLSVDHPCLLRTGCIQNFRNFLIDSMNLSQFLLGKFDGKNNDFSISIVGFTKTKILY